MLAIPKVTPPKLERNELEMNIKNNLQRFVVLNGTQSYKTTLYGDTER